MNGVLLLLAASVLVVYIDRSNLSVAADMIKGELGITDLQLGTLLSAFFWTYACLQIPAGWLVDRFDVKWVFAAGFFLWSAATAVTGLVHGFTALILARVILGIGESIAFPSYCNIFSTHFPESRRGNANAVLQAGLALGPAIGMSAGGMLVGRFGWRPFFLLLGLGCLLWLAPWIAVMPPRTRPIGVSGPKVGILDILQLRSAWGSCVGQFCLNYCMYLLVTWLPSYLMRARHLSMNEMARAGGIIFLLYAASALTFGKLSDMWITRGASASLVRKTTLGVGLTVLGIALAVVTIASDRWVVPVLGIAGIFLGMAGGSSWAVAQTLAGPEAAGRWAGVQNFVGNFAGVVAPALTGYLLGRTGQFYWPLGIAAVVSCIGSLCWVFMVGRVEPVTWPQKMTEHDPSIESTLAAGAQR